MLYAVSIRQPFASLILAGEKRYEARSWSLAEPGWLLVHASTNTGLSHTEVNADPYIRKAIKKANLEERSDWIRGAIIGAMEVTGFKTPPVKGFTKKDIALCGDDADVLWTIGETIVFPESIPCKGKLGLFEPDDDVMKRISRFVSY